MAQIIRDLSFDLSSSNDFIDNSIKFNTMNNLLSTS